MNMHISKFWLKRRGKNNSVSKVRRTGNFIAGQSSCGRQDAVKTLQTEIMVIDKACESHLT